MRDVDRGDPELELDPPDLLPQLDAHLGVERGERLVEQEHARLDREGAGERHPLLHAARELMRVSLAGVGEPDKLEQLAHTLPPAGLRLFTDLEPVLDVLLRRHVREQAVGLEDHAHVSAVRRDARHVLAVDEDGARVWLVEARDEPEGGRLAATARTEQGDELARFEGEVDALQRGHGSERAPEPLELDVGVGGHYLPIPTRTVR